MWGIGRELVDMLIRPNNTNCDVSYYIQFFLWEVLHVSTICNIFI